MQLVAPLGKIGIAVACVVVVPWLTLGTAILFLKAGQKGADLRWFHLPPLIVLVVSAYVITIQAVMLAAAVEKLTGYKLKVYTGPQAPPRSSRVA